MSIQELQLNGCVYVPYLPELRAGVLEAAEAWKAFCALPKEAKLRFAYAGDTNVSGNGYELKEGSAYDLKENMHLRLEARDDLVAQARLVDDTVAPAFVEKALALSDLLAPMVRDFATAVENEVGIPGFAEDVLANRPSWLIRFLHYFGDRELGDVIATAHNDKGGFTPHLYESAPGVERLTFDTREWVPMTLPAGQTVIIAGNGLQHRSACKIRAVSHRVVATEETAKQGRYAAVCFTNFRNAKHFDKKRFGPQQAWPPGSFYDMPFAEFDKFFV